LWEDVDGLLLVVNSPTVKRDSVAAILCRGGSQTVRQFAALPGDTSLETLTDFGENWSEVLWLSVPEETVDSEDLEPLSTLP